MVSRYTNNIPADISLLVVLYMKPYAFFIIISGFTDIPL